MHDAEDGQPRPRSLRAAADPLRGAPQAGRWVLWHGPQALAVLRLAEELGRPASQEERAAVQLPAEASQPLEAYAPAWVLEQGPGRWLVRRDQSGEYVSAYLVGLAVHDGAAASSGAAAEASEGPQP